MSIALIFENFAFRKNLSAQEYYAETCKTVCASQIETIHLHIPRTAQNTYRVITGEENVEACPVIQC